MTTTVTSWADAVKTSFTNAFGLLLGAIPRIIGFLLILAIGWFIASLVGKAVAALLRKIHFNDLAQRSGITGFIEDMGLSHDASQVMAGLCKWFIRLIVLVTAFDELGLPAISQVLQRFTLWLPNLIVALVILGIGGIAASALARLVRGAATEAGFGQVNLLEKVTRVAVWAFAILVAVNQIGIASNLVNTLFLGFVAAFGLAFGLGGRDTAAQIVRGWYQRGQQAGEQLSSASAEDAQRRIERAAASSGGSPAPAAVPQTDSVPR